MKKLTKSIFPQGVKKNSFQIKILLAFTLSISLVIIILSLVLYIYFEKVTINRIYISESNNLFQAGVSTRLMLESAKGIAIQMYNDYALAPLFFVPPEEPLEIYNSLTSFKKYRALIPYIHSLYIYNPANATFYINSPAKTDMIQPQAAFFDQEIIRILADPTKINSQVPLPRIIREPGILQNRNGENGVYTFLFNLSGANDARYPGTVIVNISETWVRDIIDSLDKEPRIKTLIIDDADRLLISDNRRELLSQAGIYHYLVSMITAGEKSGFIVARITGVKTFLVYSRIENFNWIFVKLIPYDNITRDLFILRKNLLLIGLVILLSGSCLALFLARGVYKPIAQLFKRLSVLEENRKGDLPVLLRHNLKRLLTESAGLSSYELSKFTRELNLGWQEKDFLNLLLWEIDGYRDFREKYSAHEQNLLKIGLIDCIIRGITPHYLCIGIDEGEKHLIFLLNSKNQPREQYAGQLTALVTGILKTVKATYALSLSVCLSPGTDKPETLSVLLTTVQQAIRNKYLLGTGAIIRIDEPGVKQQREFQYPARKEELFMDALNLGQQAKALELYTEIMQAAAASGYNAVLTTRNSLAYEINKTVNSLKKYSILNFSFGFSAFFTRLNDTETLDETHSLFSALISQLTEAVNKRNGMANYELISRTIKLIETGYADINLGIATLADKLKLSAAYLGRLFYRFTGKTMTDYINETRVARAGLLLETTTSHITEIMQCCGFSNKTHFYSVFKKYKSMTPNAYRRKAALKPAEN